jgi:hypothetical protein
MFYGEEDILVSEMYMKRNANAFTNLGHCQRRLRGEGSLSKVIQFARVVGCHQ